MPGVNLERELNAIHGRHFIVVSNRQPFAHMRHGRTVTIEKPASGLTLALEPIVQAARGTWIATASGNADADFVDAGGAVKALPPGVRYRLRRLFLPPRLASDYYDGFANATLWPLCHIAYHKPRFEERWWRAYVRANELFADMVVAASAGEPAIVFIQDFHLALLPAMLRARCPQALVAQFWHIPWPNPEAFRICPWRKEILRGLLGNHLLGFHLAYHRLNFLQTVDRELEARVDAESNTVVAANSRTQVSAFPISVDYQRIRAAANSAPARREAAVLRRRFAPGRRLVLSIERMDYSKGILERLEAIERFFERHPQWRGRVSFVHIATPSRTRVPAYRAYAQAVERQVARLNASLASADWVPVKALPIYVAPERVWSWYKAADALVVASLHDGMNLVAKEFVAAGRDDAVLILSEFTGAARELREAALVNPFATDAFADALAAALEMSPEQRRERLARLRWRVANHDVASWARDILRALRQHEFDANHHHTQPAGPRQEKPRSTRMRRPGPAQARSNGTGRREAIAARARPVAGLAGPEPRPEKS